MKRRRARSPLSACLHAACLLTLLGYFLFSLARLDRGQDMENLQQLEAALRRAAVACYATEGFYPPNLDYLETHYGLHIDKDRYTVVYDAFAENLMPDITVLERGA